MHRWNNGTQICQQIEIWKSDLDIARPNWFEDGAINYYFSVGKENEIVFFWHVDLQLGEPFWFLNLVGLKICAVFLRGYQNRKKSQLTNGEASWRIRKARLKVALLRKLTSFFRIFSTIENVSTLEVEYVNIGQILSFQFPACSGLVASIQESIVQKTMHDLLFLPAPAMDPDRTIEVYRIWLIVW